MKKFFFAALAAIALASCTIHQEVSNGPLTSEKRALTGFERIEQRGSVDIKYRQGDSCSVVVEAPSKLISRIRTEQRGNRLVVSMDDGLSSTLVHGIISQTEDITVYITSPDLIGVELSGSGDFDGEGLIDTDDLTIQLKGSGDIEFDDIICDRLRTTLVGSGDIEVKHVVTQRSDIELVGSGDISIRHENTAQSNINLKGSGDIKCTYLHSGAVSARLLGSGDITLRGDIRKLDRYSNGSGDIHTNQLQVKQ